ncbi:MAG: hypothetical protein ACFB8W_08020 [Elainellaceae cyanobacterium]
MMRNNMGDRFYTMPDATTRTLTGSFSNGMTRMADRLPNRLKIVPRWDIP